MDKPIVHKKARNRTRAQKRAARERNLAAHPELANAYDRRKINPHLVAINPCRGCGEPLNPDTEIPFCSIRCVRKAADSKPFKIFCSTCHKPNRVSLEIHLEGSDYICDACKEKERREAETKRDRQIRLATPKWADMNAICRIYEQCKLITKETGIKHEVDHIVPVISDLVCGLNIAVNLRVITREENQRKSNKLDTSLI